MSIKKTDDNDKFLNALIDGVNEKNIPAVSVFKAPQENPVGYSSEVSSIYYVDLPEENFKITDEIREEMENEPLSILIGETDDGFFINSYFLPDDDSLFVEPIIISNNDYDAAFKKTTDEIVDRVAQVYDKLKEQYQDQDQKQEKKKSRGR